MKKLLLLIFILMLLLCACAPISQDSSEVQSANISDESTMQNTSSNANQSSAASENSKQNPTNIYVTYNNERRYLSDLYEHPFKNALTSGEWSEATADCSYDFKIQWEDKEFFYHSECGTVSLNGKSKKLNDSDKANVNALLFALFGLN